MGISWHCSGKKKEAAQDLQLGGPLQPTQELASDLLVLVSDSPISSFGEVFDVSCRVICPQPCGLGEQV